MNAGYVHRIRNVCVYINMWYLNHGGIRKEQYSRSAENGSIAPFVNVREGISPRLDWPLYGLENGWSPRLPYREAQSNVPYYVTSRRETKRQEKNM